MSARVRRRVVVRGRVQGVWFRDSCRREAELAGVAGWVRNRPDRSVEAVFEGPADAVAAIVAWCHEGPIRARVDRVEEIDEPPVGESGFRIVEATSVRGSRKGRRYDPPRGEREGGAGCS